MSPAAVKAGAFVHTRLIHYLFEQKESVEALRLYTMLQAQRAKNGRGCRLSSGLFSIDQLCDISQTYGQKSLADKKNRKKYKAKLAGLLAESSLFEQQGTEYKLRATNRLLLEHYGTGQGFRYRVPFSHLQSKRAFTDFLIGCLCSGRRYSNATLSEITGFTVRRIQQATRRNHEAGLFEKTFRLVVESYDRPADAYSQQHYLRTAHGIESRVKKITRGNFALIVNATNLYRHGTLRKKGRCWQNAGTKPLPKRRGKNWFKSIAKGEDFRRFYREKLGGVVLRFNFPAHSLDQWAADHSRAGWYSVERWEVRSA